MAKGLPTFRKRSFLNTESFIERVLTPTGSDESCLRKLVAYEDNHFRAFFDPAYFTLAEGRTEPSKSQWNTLKKKLKRYNRGVFVFKEIGATESVDGALCYCLDFGFFEMD